MRVVAVKKEKGKPTKVAVSRAKRGRRALCPGITAVGQITSKG
jgi:hypothetical protein